MTPSRRPTPTPAPAAAGGSKEASPSPSPSREDANKIIGGRQRLRLEGLCEGNARAEEMELCRLILLLNETKSSAYSFFPRAGVFDRSGPYGPSSVIRHSLVRPRPAKYAKAKQPSRENELVLSSNGRAQILMHIYIF